MYPASANFVRQFLHPVCHTEDLVDDQNNRSLVLRLGIDHEGFDRPAIVLHSHPLPMPRRLFNPLARPVLAANDLGPKSK